MSKSGWKQTLKSIYEGVRCIKDKIIATVVVLILLSVSTGLCFSGLSEASDTESDPAMENGMFVSGNSDDSVASTSFKAGMSDSRGVTSGSEADYVVDVSSTHKCIVNVPLTTSTFTVRCTYATSAQVSVSDLSVLYKGVNGDPFPFSSQNDVTARIVSVDEERHEALVQFLVNGSLNADKWYRIQIGTMFLSFVTAGTFSTTVDATDLNAGIHLDIAQGSSQVVLIQGVSNDYNLRTIVNWVSTPGPVFTKGSGFIFLKVSMDNSKVGTHQIGTITNNGENLTLTVENSAASTYKVVYDLNGGSGVAPIQGDIVDGAGFTVAQYSGIKEGYLFEGWDDGKKVYQPGDNYSDVSSDVTLTAKWFDVNTKFDYTIAGYYAALNAELPVDVHTYKIRYNGDMVKRGGVVDDTAISIRITDVNGQPITGSVSVKIDRASGQRSFAIVELTIKERLVPGSAVAISIENQKGNLYMGVSYVGISIYTEGYSKGTFDIRTEPSVVVLDAAACASGSNYLAIRGIEKKPTEMACPGINFDMAAVKDYTKDNGFAYIPFTVEDGVLVNGDHKIVATVDGKSYDLPIRVENAKTPDASHDSDYSVDVKYNSEISDAANAVLDVTITKNSNGAELEDMRLLIIAKYSGENYVFNLYSKPVMNGLKGEDRIVVSKQNLSCVIIEVVDGIQTLDPTPYGHGSYSAV